MARTKPPAIGITLDSEEPGSGSGGGYSKYPWYALRQNYATAVAAAGGLPLALAHLPDLAEAMLDRLDALVITGGAFDVAPSLYGDATTHAATTMKSARTTAELALLQGALRRDMPVLGICGGEQLLAVGLGGTLIQHIADAVAQPLAHEQPNPRHEPGHTVAIAPDTRLAAITGETTLAVNSAHHQAVRAPGRARVNAVAPDGVIEGIEDTSRRFCIGVQWHPEFLINTADRRLFDALVAACA